MSVSLLVCYFLTEIRKNMGISPSLDEISFWNFLWHSWDIGSLVFTLLGWAYILTFEFLCAGLNFETSGLVTFWFSGGQLLKPLVLFHIILNFLYVRQSVSWSFSSLKLDKYRDISSSGSDIFLQFFGDISSMLTCQFQIIQNFLYVCQSVSWLFSLLKLW